MLDAVLYDDLLRDVKTSFERRKIVPLGIRGRICSASNLRSLRDNACVNITVILMYILIVCIETVYIKCINIQRNTAS